MQEAIDEQKNSDEQLETTGRTPQGILIERPLSTSSDTHPVNGNYTLPDEDENEDDTEDDLILGDEDISTKMMTFENTLIKRQRLLRCLFYFSKIVDKRLASSIA